MTRAVLDLRCVFVAGMVVALGTLTGCGGDSGSSGSASSGSIDRSASSGATIAGIPVTTAVAGQPYTFQPKAANTSGAVRFTVAHLPSWAKFDTSTGQLSGTPNASQVGQYAGIAIDMVSGTSVVSLPPFTITVAAAGSTSNTVTLSWEAPTENADGSTLMDLKGYKVHYGPTSKGYQDIIQVSNPGLTTYVVQNLPAGKYYFAITAYNASGKESSLSGEVSTQVD